MDAVGVDTPRPQYKHPTSFWGARLQRGRISLPPTGAVWAACLRRLHYQAGATLRGCGMDRTHEVQQLMQSGESDDALSATASGRPRLSMFVLSAQSIVRQAT